MPPESPFATSPLGGDGPIDAPGTARKPTRKIARAPFKARAGRASRARERSCAPPLPRHPPHPAAVAGAGRAAAGGRLLSEPGALLAGRGRARASSRQLTRPPLLPSQVDWTSANVLAVGLGACVYLWSACTSKVTKLADLSGTTPEAGDAVTSVSWSQRGSFLAIGTGKGEVQLWDVRAAKKVRTCGGHRARVASLAWTGSTLSSGSRDRSIINRDVRAAEESFGKLTAHRSEVCGLRWSPDGRELASGGNDNALCVWSSAAGTAAEPYLRFTSHTAAVKALAWSPHAHGLLASGGGTADRHIRFWNTSSGAELSAIDTGSQVCSLAWSKNCDELVSTHGYSQNQVVVWRYPSMTKVATLTGHTMRVLYLAVSPDGTSVVTGAGDETLRFWSVFPPSASGGAASDTSVLCLGRSSIR